MIATVYVLLPGLPVAAGGAVGTGGLPRLELLLVWAEAVSAVQEDLLDRDVCVRFNGPGALVEG